MEFNLKFLKWKKILIKAICRNRNIVLEITASKDDYKQLPTQITYIV